jgi:fructokinase
MISRHKTPPASRRSPRPTVAGTGMTAVDRIYSTDRAVPLQALGGSCGNVLLSLAMLGHPVSPMVTLGDDEHGRFLFQEFAKAGCETSHVSRGGSGGSPVIVEIVDSKNATHRFTSTCPETARSFPRWQSIDDGQVRRAAKALKAASVFYADRVSASILLAMKAAEESRALVFFEPASVEDAWFPEALRTASVLKLSDATVGKSVQDGDVSPETVIIRTYGASGLTVSLGTESRYFPSMSAPRLVDTCGAGDMVTTALLDLILRRCMHGGSWTIEDLFEGVQLGQRLAALNCAFEGARGLFFAAGAGYVRSILDHGIDEGCSSYVRTLGSHDGY